MSELPCDILQNILSRVPAKDLLRFKTVSKLWKGIIDDPFFVKSHNKNQPSCPADILIRNNHSRKLFSLSVDCLTYADGVQNIGLIPVKQIIHPSVPVLAALPADSCNGLILITHKRSSWAIWNPLIQNFNEVPLPPHLTNNESNTILGSSGFGYDEASDDYKVVRIDGVHGYHYEILYYTTLIYSLKSRCWKAIEGFPAHSICGRGVYLNGALHWRSRHGIIALHLGREDHHLMAGPPPINKQEYWFWERLDASDGCLIWSYGHENNNNKRIDAWVLMNDDKAWTRLFTIDVEPNARAFRVVAYLKSKGQVLLCQDGSNVLKLYHLKDKSCKEIKLSFSGMHNTLLSFAQFSPGSLVRLDSTNRTRDGVKGKKMKEVLSVRCAPSNWMR